MSAYGGVVATNRPVTAEMAEQVAEVFTEVVVAPDFEPEALEILTRKKNIRLLRLPAGMERTADQVEFRAISGGVLMQTRDKIDAVVDGGGDDPSRWTLVAGDAADEATLADLAFAWRAIRAVKSNAILLADERRERGCRHGPGQPGRLLPARGLPRRGASGPGRRRGLRRVLPVRRRPAGAAGRRRACGRRSPGGSVRDAEVVEAAAKAGVALYFTGTRHFAH